MGNINKDKSIYMAKYSAFNPYRIRQRELGFPSSVGEGDAIAKSLYYGMRPIASWDSERDKILPTGGIFNLEFSPEGTLLVAACEKKSFQIFDPLTHERIHSVNGAHADCVNCVKFLDGRMFATCSDDTTIALWDVRNLKKKIRTLLGHSKWVKNIEFSVKDKLLVTSGLDGSIYTWDINSYTEYNLIYERVFHTSSLMRCRLSPDAKQMVMCTTGGLIVLIHNLNLNTLAQDFHGFKPNLYRLMQMSRQSIPVAAMYDHLFDSNRKENRVEFVSDFPGGNDAEVVSALQIHPQGWSALSRNISHDDKSEWTCIHDIQPVDESSSKGTRDTSPSDGGTFPGDQPRSMRRRLRARMVRSAHIVHSPITLMRREARQPRLVPGSRSVQISGARASLRRITDTYNMPLHHIHISREGDVPAAGPSTSRDAPPAPAAPPVPQPSRLAGGLSGIQNDVWEASITIKQQRIMQEMYNRQADAIAEDPRGQVRRNFNMQRITGINTGLYPPSMLSPRVALVANQGDDDLLPLPRSSSPSPSGQTPPHDSTPGTSDEERSQSPIRRNRKRLLYYTEETNEGKGFIKELCYSADGRIVCSPFGRGMRLLALNHDCGELCNCVQDLSSPRTMVEVGQSQGIHQDLVVSSRFSPRYHMLVTGDLEGKIVWHQPFSGESMH